MKRRNYGFGLIEVLLLALIVGILTSTVLPALKNKKNKNIFREISNISPPITASIDKCLGFERDTKQCNTLEKLRSYGYSATAIEILSQVDSISLVLKNEKYRLTVTPSEENPSSPFIKDSHTYVRVADIVDRNGRPVIEAWSTDPKSGCMIAGLCQ